MDLKSLEYLLVKYNSIIKEYPLALIEQQRIFNSTTPQKHSKELTEQVLKHLRQLKIFHEKRYIIADKNNWTDQNLNRFLHQEINLYSFGTINPKTFWKIKDAEYLFGNNFFSKYNEAGAVTPSKAKQWAAISDNQAKLMWACNLPSATFSPVVEGKTWPEATEFVNEVNQHKWAGYSDWRLPTIEELRRLGTFHRQYYLLFPEKFAHDTYWSSSIDKSYPIKNKVGSYSMYLGARLVAMHSSFQEAQKCVRMVRSIE